MLTYETINAVRSLCKNYNRELQRLSDLKFFSCPSPPKLDGMPHAQATTSKTESVAMLILEGEKKIAALTEQIEHAKFLLLTQLDSFTVRELPRRVLNYHYVGCQSFSAIARIMHFARSYIFHLHDEGLRACGLDSREMIAFKKRAHLTNIDMH